MAGRIFVLISLIGWLVLALIVVTALLAVAGVDRFEPPVANPPT